MKALTDSRQPNCFSANSANSPHSGSPASPLLERLSSWRRSQTLFGCGLPCSLVLGMVRIQSATCRAIIVAAHLPSTRSFGAGSNPTKYCLSQTTAGVRQEHTRGAIRCEAKQPFKASPVGAILPDSKAHVLLRTPYSVCNPISPCLASHLACPHGLKVLQK